QPFDPADALEVIENALEVGRLKNVHLPEQASVPLQGKVRQRRDQEVTAQYVLFHGLALVSGMIDQNVGEDCDSGQSLDDLARVTWSKVEEFSFVADQFKSQRFKIIGVSRILRAQSGEVGLIFRREVTPSS